MMGAKYVMMVMMKWRLGVSLLCAILWEANGAEATAWNGFFLRGMMMMVMTARISKMKVNNMGLRLTDERGHGGGDDAGRV